MDGDAPYQAAAFPGTSGVWTKAAPEAILCALCASFVAFVLKIPVNTKATKDLTKNTKPAGRFVHTA
jgi:hypothetical protein